MTNPHGRKIVGQLLSSCRISFWRRPRIGGKVPRSYLEFIKGLRGEILSWPLFFCLAFFVSSCGSRPVEELALADVALKAAQKSKADAFAADDYRKAENNFLRAKKDFTDGYFDSCRKFSIESRLAAEQAEYKSLYKQNQIKSAPVEKSSDVGSEPAAPPAVENPYLE